jgi:hypothetical protein
MWDDPDAALKDRVCAELAEAIYERVPRHPPGGVDGIKQSLLNSLGLELVEDQINQELHRDVTNAIFWRVFTSAFGSFLSFGRPIDEAVKGAKRRRRILEAARKVASDYEAFLSRTAAVLSEPNPDLSQLGSILTGSIRRDTEAIVRFRRVFVARTAIVCAVLIAAIWTTVHVTSIAWQWGAAWTCATVIAGWWRYKHIFLRDS